jgi:hypothetical protein
MHVEVVLGTEHVTSPVYLQHTIITLYQARIKLNVLYIGRCSPKENPEENTRAPELLRPRNLSRILRSRHLDGISNHIEATCSQKRHESMAPVVCTARRRTPMELKQVRIGSEFRINFPRGFSFTVPLGTPTRTPKKWFGEKTFQPPIVFGGYVGSPQVLPHVVLYSHCA